MTAQRARARTPASSTGSRSAPRTGSSARAAEATRAPSSLLAGPDEHRAPEPALRERVGERRVALRGPALGRREGAPGAERDEVRRREPRGRERGLRGPHGGLRKGEPGRILVGRDPVRGEQRVVVAQLVSGSGRLGQPVRQQRPATIRDVADAAFGSRREGVERRRETSSAAATPRRTGRAAASPRRTGRTNGAERRPRSRRPDRSPPVPRAPARRANPKDAPAGARAGKAATSRRRRSSSGR